MTEDSFLAIKGHADDYADDNDCGHVEHDGDITHDADDDADITDDDEHEDDTVPIKFARVHVRASMFMYTCMCVHTPVFVCVCACV